MPDAIHRLRSLADEEQVVSHLPAEEVRRLGDRMRRRRTAVAALSTAAAVAVITSGGLAVTQDLISGPSPAPATQAPSPHPSPAPSGTPPSANAVEWRTTIPEGFPLAVGLPRPGGDVPAWTVSDDVEAPWRHLPCPTDPTSFETTLPQDAGRTDAESVVANPPSMVASRQLVLYPDQATAVAAVQAIRDRAEQCGPLEAVPGLTELRYAVVDMTFGNTEGTFVGGGEYILENGSRGPSRLLTTVVRVGNAVFVGGLSDESAADPFDIAEPGAATLYKAATAIAEEMCVFAEDPC